jgi:hypothetical protein
MNDSERFLGGNAVEQQRVYAMALRHLLREWDKCPLRGLKGVLEDDEIAALLELMIGD